jgi:hypothetical protein
MARFHPVRGGFAPVFAAALTACTLALHPGDAAAQDLPDADALIAAYVEAAGGADRFEGASSVTHGTLSMPAAGVEGQFELVQIYPDRMRMNVNIPGLGEILSGYDGENGWSLNPMMGPMVMSGAELEQTREQASVAASLRDVSMVPGRETVEDAEYDGVPCWKVRLTWVSGRVTHDCYAKDTGLLVASESTQVTQMGDMPIVSIFREYREFEGRQVATHLVQRVAGQEQVMRIDSVEYGEVDEERVQPPQAIQALIGG